MSAIPLRSLIGDLDPKSCKLHCAVWNNEDHPIDVLTRSWEEWVNWSRWRPARDEFNRPYIFAMARDRNDPSHWLFGGVFEVLERGDKPYAHSYKIALREDLMGPFIKTLSRVTSLAVDLIDGVDHADVMLIGDDGFRSVAPSAPVVTKLDEAQLRLDEGPCLAAATGHSTIRSDNLEAEARWPQFAAAAVAAGIKSMLSFQLFTHRNGSGALNLLSQRPYAFNRDGEAMGAMLATHAAIALMHADQQRQFDSALASHDLIAKQRA
jgi:GAF domain